MLPDRQHDLFAASGQPASPTVPTAPQPSALRVDDLDDTTLIMAIPDAGLATCRSLTDEAGRRGLIAAVPALEALCRRFKGFGLRHAVPEQAAALAGLVAVGGPQAASSVARMIAEGVVQGPGLDTALAAAARLNSRLPPNVVAALLRHPKPGIRADAARCAPRHPAAITLLIELLDDLNSQVAKNAACSLGGMGRPEARPMLVRLLREEPTPMVIDAVIPIADEVCIVMLGRIARSMPALSGHVLAALEDIDNDRAAAVVSTLRHPPSRDVGRPATSDKPPRQ